MKEEGNGRGSEKSLMSAPMTDQGIVIERIDTLEIVKELETEIGTEGETMVVIAIEHVIEVGIVVVTMSVIEKEIVTRTGTGIMMLVTMAMGVLGIGNLIMTVLSPNMSGTGTVRGIMIMVSQMRIESGMNSMIMGIGVQT